MLINNILNGIRCPFLVRLQVTPNWAPIRMKINDII